MVWEWNAEFETGIEKIDEQHKELFNRIDQLELAIYKGSAAAELVKLMEYLESYITEHFELEEKLMLENLYPDFAAHTRLHEEFRIVFTRILNNFNSKNADNYLAIDIDKQMRKWWENHILKMDMAYIPYLKKQALLKE
jgi:hemerythrin